MDYKIWGCIFAAFLTLFGTKTFFEVREEMSHKEVGKLGYSLPKPEPAADSGNKPAAEKVAFSFDLVKPLLASASAEAGQKVFRKCAACHTPNKGGANRVGPNLWNVVNRDIASLSSFNYSSALKKIEGGWTFEELSKFMHKPKKYAAGTKMVFAGLKSESDIADLLAYLNSLSDSPQAMGSN
ncbi:MAG: cytochrome c family protein [Pseudomonadota bacterium]